jgi:transcriptional regulator with XRE-family HTH domain
MITATVPVGTLLREWRHHRRLSQEALALEAGVSTRHISFLENGRSRPSREMLQRLAERLDLPLRERNQLLVAAGFAPVYPERSLDDATMTAARSAVSLVLAGHEPYPALAVDRHWNLIAANRAAGPFFTGVAAHLQTPPVNVLRATLHPDGLAPRIANFAQWRAHTLSRVQRQWERTGDPVLLALLEELHGYPAPDGVDSPETANPGAAIVVPLRMRTEFGVLAFLYTTTLFGAPHAVTLAEIAIESFFPADAATADALRRAAGGTSAGEMKGERISGWCVLPAGPF